MDALKLLTTIDVSDESQGPPVQERSAYSVYWQLGKFFNNDIVFISSKDNSVKGALGISDIKLICDAFDFADREKLSIVFYLNSSGAKLDDGIAIQASFRKLIGRALEFKQTGGKLVFLLGRNIFGGASILAMSGDARFYSEDTRVSMTGPRVLIVKEDEDQKYVESIISRDVRVKADPGAVYLDYGSDKEAEDVLKNALFSCSGNLYEEFYSVSRMLKGSGFLSNRIVIEAEGVSCLGNAPPSPLDLLSLASVIDDWVLPGVIKINCEWSSHSILAKHEESYQSKILYMLSEVLYKKRKSGNSVVCYLLDNISGGIYIALSAGSDKIYAKKGVEVESLPSQIVSAIKKNDNGSSFVSNSCLLESGVVDCFF
ncbi:hypothetical protein [Halomonas sp. GT]|uniref:hypothetical protein n=1 Tax=Halomonas sp. GT TaxID=1971364 RepID=UPI0009F3FD32|nr:hypothetical protein [Halomonas sp. GT]